MHNPIDTEGQVMSNHDKHPAPPAVFIEPGEPTDYVSVAKALGGSVLPVGRDTGDRLPAAHADPETWYRRGLTDNPSAFVSGGIGVGRSTSRSDEAS